MRKLILATASAFALSLAMGGAGFAAEPASNAQLPQGTQPSATMPAPNQAMPAQTQNMQTPNEAATPQQGAEAQTAPMQLTPTQVKEAQQALKADGLYKGEIDGKIGPETKQAIEQFQQQNGLQQTGVMDEQTFAALNHANNGVGQGSSMTPGAQQPGEATNPNMQQTNPNPQQQEPAGTQHQPVTPTQR
ncbi:MAG TPA: peptidoglycan-binding domain-containing protein [Stellaceae bacterium]|nr:peptidoglycan-binding domain-containing protein [Stellaceae bacterium]